MAKSEVEKVMGHDIGPFSGIQVGLYIDRNLSVFGDAGQTAMTVSYTHLDVYKRQIQDRAEAIIM